MQLCPLVALVATAILSVLATSNSTAHGSTDRIEWSLNIPPLKNSYGPSGATTAVTHDDQFIYFVDTALNVNKVNRSNGALLWSVNPLNRTKPYASTFTDPLTLLPPQSTTIVFGNISFYCGLNIVDGSTSWCRSFTHYFDPIMPYAFDDRLLLVDLGGRITNAFDIDTGVFAWNYSSQYINDVTFSPYGMLFAVSNYVEETSDGVLLDTKTGTLLATFPNVEDCLRIFTGRYAVCSTLLPQQSIAQVIVIDLKTKEVLWSRDLGPPDATVNVEYYLNEDTLVVVGVSNWAAAFNLMSGGEPYWNITLANPAYVAPTNLIEFEGTYIIPATLPRFAKAMTISFVSLDSATGSTIFSITPPTTAQCQVIVVGGNLIIPNMLGWTRWSRGDNSSNAGGARRSETPTLQYHQLDQLGGLLNVLAQGDNGYIVITPSGFSKFVFS